MSQDTKTQILDPMFSGNCQASDSSGAAESDCYLAGFDNGRDFSPAFRMLEHLLEFVRVSSDVDVLNRITAFAVILTGGRGVRSAFLAVNHYNSIAHSVPPVSVLLTSSL